MKKLFIAIAALAAMTSCSQDEVMEVAQKQAISFGSAFVGNATRAASATDPSYYTDGEDKHEQLEAFNVYGTVNGVNIFNGNEVTKGTAAYGAVWTQVGTPQYWVPNANYAFVAIVDGNKTVDSKKITETATDKTTGMPTTITYNADGKTDLLCARVNRPTNINYDVVAFEFKHLLSKVKFSIENTSAANATNYRYVISGATLTNVYESGTYNVPTVNSNGSNGTWSYPQATGSYALDSEFTVNSATVEFNESEVLLIPGSAVGISFTVELQTKDAKNNWVTVSSEDKTYEAVLGENNVLVANSAYHFILKVGIGGLIQFTATEMPSWTTVGDITVATITDPEVDEEEGEGGTEE